MKKLSDVIHDVNIKLLTVDAIVPTKGTEYSAGYDLYTTEDYDLSPNEHKLFKTGISIKIPNGIYGRIAPRSGLALKSGIDVLAGVIDEDYRGEIGVILINFGKETKSIKKGDRIAQIIFEFYNKINFITVNDLDKTERGEGGWGHSDGRVTVGPSLSISDMYRNTGGIPTKEKYTEEIKKRDS